MSRPGGTLSRSLLALSVTLLMVSTYASTRTVCSSGCDHESIQAAVNAARQGDTIELGAETFVENVSIIEKDLQILGAGSEQTVIDGGGADSVFFLDLHEETTTICCGPRDCRQCREEVLYSVTLSGLTIRNGAGERGGGVEQLSGRLTVRDCVIENNAAVSGGGVLAQGFNLEGVEALNIENCVIRDNLADTGGGIYIESLGVAPVITRTTISGNSGSPSAIYNYSEDYPFSLNLSVVNGNVGYAAIASGSGYPRISTSTISGNTGAGVEGRGAYIWNSTITGNGSGIYGVSYLQARNSIVAGNNLGDCALIGTVASSGNNLIGSSCIESGSWVPHPTDIETADPLLLPLADNGGPTQTHALRAGSPAIDAGASCASIDQRGVSRPQDGNGDGVETCDIGAFEFVPPAALLEELVETVASLGLPHGIENSMLAKLNAASLILGDLEEGNDHAAANVLGAFIRQVQAQYGRKIAVADADALIQTAEEIIELLSGDMRIRRDEFRRRLFSPGRRLRSEPQEPE